MCVCVAATAEGDLDDFRLLATSSGDVVVYNDVTNAVERVKARNSTNTMIASVASHMITTGVNISQQGFFTAGIGIDRVRAVSMPIRLQQLTTKWTLVVALKQEEFQTARRAWGSVSLVFAVPVVFVTVMMSVVLYPKDATDAAGSTYVVYAGLAVIPFPLAITTPQRAWHGYGSADWHLQSDSACCGMMLDKWSRPTATITTVTAVMMAIAPCTTQRLQGGGRRYGHCNNACGACAEPTRHRRR